MLFEVSAAGFYYFEEGDSILNYYPQLKQYFKEFHGDYAVIELKTLEELMKLQVALDERLIIEGNSILIYDDYIE